MIGIICVRQRTGHLEHLRRMCSANKNWIVTRMEKSNYRPNVVRSADVSLCTFIPSTDMANTMGFYFRAVFSNKCCRLPESFGTKTQFFYFKWYLN